MKLRAIALLFAVLTTAPDATALEVLTPRDGQRFAGEGAWVVLQADSEPRVTLAGETVPGAVGDSGTFHFRLQGLTEEGVVLAIDSSGEERRLTLYGNSVPGERFHATETPACWTCHDRAGTGCVECHVWEGLKHEPMLAEGCGRCHASPDLAPLDIVQVCSRCHPEYGSGKHGRLRHAVRSERDPLRPGQEMDCASCHDPHAPRCLSCLGRSELRSWCKRCHGRL